MSKMTTELTFQKCRVNLTLEEASATIVIGYTLAGVVFSSLLALALLSTLWTNLQQAHCKSAVEEESNGGKKKVAFLCPDLYVANVLETCSTCFLIIPVLKYVLSDCWGDFRRSDQVGLTAIVNQALACLQMTMFPILCTSSVITSF